MSLDTDRPRVALLRAAPQRPTPRRDQHLLEANPLPARLRRYPGGTYSPTVETIVLRDGSRLRTDLIRVNPSIPAYSLDVDGVAPRGPVGYHPTSWYRWDSVAVVARRARIAAILRTSVPAVSTAELSRRLRAAGVPLGPSDITEPAAIAATQAAIWHLTNGLELDTRPLTMPVRAVAVGLEGRRTELEPGADGVGWSGPTAVARHIEVEFEIAARLGGYSLVASSAARVALEKSADGVSWSPVAGSAASVAGAADVAVPAEATVASAGPGGVVRGYRHYRLTVDGPTRIEDLRFRFVGCSAYRNPEPVVLLLQYLLALPSASRESTRELRLLLPEAAGAGTTPLATLAPAHLRVVDGGRARAARVRNPMVDADEPGLEWERAATR
ncbi:hypothetical protein GCM10023147_40490 [Tsukamurella soli]|uniref:Thioester domain-containing protein n=1 Tax=Tsukamurella soli TaxID=644556 RepID=A0ABP8K7B3_9ACTN